MIFVHALGMAQIDAGTARVKPTSTRRFALLLYLAAEAGRRVSRTTLHELICPDQTEKNARHTLRELLYKCRQAGADLVSDHHGVEVRADVIRSDYELFVQKARLEEEDFRAASGGFLPSYSPDHSEAYSEWYEAFRAKSVSDISRSILREMARARASCDWLSTEHAARACLALDSVNEEATLVLAEMLALAGAKVKALEILDSYASDVGQTSGDLKLPAVWLRRRIGEQQPFDYASSATSPIIGRQSEMALLQQLLNSTPTAKSRVAVISGEPGIGKTRLTQRFLELAQLQRVTVVRSVARPNDEARPLGAFIDVVQSLLDAPGALGCSPESHASLVRLTRQGSAEGHDPSNASLESTFYMVRRAIADLVSAVTDERPLILILEDAHWLDQHSLAAVVEVAQRCESRLLVVLTSRSETVSRDLGSRLDALIHIPLGRLDRDESLQLARHVLGEKAADVPMQEWILAKSGGNPLFINAIGTHYRLTGNRFEAPSTLLDLLRQRIRALTRSAEAALYACVALGRWCSLERFAAVLEMPHLELILAVEELRIADLIVDSTEGLSPSHPLVAEAFQMGGTDVARRLTHRQVARVLEMSPGYETSPTLAWDCSEHWVAAGENSRAIRLLRRCATHAIAIGRACEAAKTLHRAALLAGNDERTTLLREAILTAGLGAEFDLVLEYVAELRTIDSSIEHDDVEMCELNALAVTYSDARSFEGRIQTCMAAANATPHHRVLACLAALKYADVTSRRAVAELARTAIGRTDLAEVDELLRLEYELVLEATSGNLDAAAACARSLLARLGDGAAGARQGSLTFNAGIALWLSGYPYEGVEACKRAYAIARQIGAVRLSILTALQISGILFDLEDERSALDWLASAKAVMREADGEIGQLEVVTLEIDVALADGETELAHSLLGQARRANLFNTAPRRRWERAFRIRLAQLGSPAGSNDDEIEGLLSDHPGTTPLTGIRDFEMAVVLHHLRYVNRRRARELAGHYLLDERKAESPVSRCLQAVLKMIDCGDLIDGWRIRRNARVSSARKNPGTLGTRKNRLASSPG